MQREQELEIYDDDDDDDDVNDIINIFNQPKY